MSTPSAHVLSTDGSGCTLGRVQTVDHHPPGDTSPDPGRISARRSVTSTWLRQRAGDWVGLAAEACELVLPRPCPGCGGVGPFCAGCRAPLEGRPREPVLPEVTVDALSRAGPFPSVRALCRYTGPPRAAVIAGKERGRRDLPPVLGAALGDALVRLHRVGLVQDRVTLVPAPTKPSAARRRGGDPVHRMARRAAERLAAAGISVAVAPLLLTARAAADQAGLDAAARSTNLSGNVRLRGRLPAGSSQIIVLDDVLTTGATIAAASAALAQQADAPVGLVLTVASVPPFRALR